MCGHDSCQMGRSARSSNEDLDAAFLGGSNIFGRFRRRAMRGKNAAFVRLPKPPSMFRRRRREAPR